jgi:hypothetical protein
LLTNVFCVQDACQLLARWFAESIFSTLKMEAICSSETSVETQRTTRRHIPEEDTLQDILSLNPDPEIACGWFFVVFLSLSRLLPG